MFHYLVKQKCHCIFFFVIVSETYTIRKLKDYLC